MFSKRFMSTFSRDFVVKESLEDETGISLTGLIEDHYETMRKGNYYQDLNNYDGNYRGVDRQYIYISPKYKDSVQEGYYITSLDGEELGDNFYIIKDKFTSTYRKKSATYIVLVAEQVKGSNAKSGGMVL